MRFLDVSTTALILVANESYKRICPICEAACGLVISAEGRVVTAIDANNNDVFSTGHVCAKGLALAELDADPDRLRTPLVRKNGTLVPASFDEAFGWILEKLTAVKDVYGANAVASYIGNPTAHNIGLSMGLGIFLGTLGSTNVFSAGSVDQIPKQLASALMFGDEMAVPVPDIERADFLLMLGANPIVSNGSLWMVPGFRKKLRAFRSRGGTFVTVDPRLTETARLADVHLGVKPGTDAWLLAALINELQHLGCSLAERYVVEGWSELASSLQRVTTEYAAEVTGISKTSIQDLAASIAAATHPVVYGRVGTTLQPFGTLTSFLVEVVNLLTGCLDQPGGALFPEQPYAEAGSRRPGPRHNRYQSRVSGAAEVLGQMPVSVLAEEIETPGDGQIKAMICFAGNPVVSNPDSERLARALESLDFLVCVDIYHNETTRLADVILPGTSPFEDAHYDSFLGSMGYRNVARYSPPIFQPHEYSEWQIGLAMTCLLKNARVPDAADLRDCEDDVVAAAIARYTADADGALQGRDVQQILAMIEPASGVERLLDLGIRAGRFGDHFGRRVGLTLQRMIDAPDGIDLGAPRANRLQEIINTPSGALELAPSLMLREVDRLLKMKTQPQTKFHLVGKRGTRTNNSWLGNLDRLGKGSRQCVLEMHPSDAQALELASGDQAKVESAISNIIVEVQVTDRIMQGVVSLPHGFSDDGQIRQHKRQTGANYNQLIPATAIDEPSGTSALNGYPVCITKA